MNSTRLYDLFITIRNEREWVSPGMEEYYLLLELLQKREYTINNFNDFAFVLETMWLKSHHQRDKFRALLEQRRAELEMLYHEWKKGQQQAPENNNPDTPKTGGAQNANPGNKKEEPSIPQPAGGANEQTNNETGSNNNNNETGATATGDQEFGDTAIMVERSQNIQGEAQSVSVGKTQHTNRPVITYLLSSDYYPVTTRQIQQAWRALKKRTGEGNTGEIDIENTINKVAEQGHFTGFRYRQQQINQAQLFVFIDQAESMVAMESFGTALCEAALQSETHKNIGPWFYYLTPAYNATLRDYELTNRHSTQKTSLRHLFRPYNKKNIVVLIYSDAGAYTADNDREWAGELQQFIQYLVQHTAYIAWLNPAPRRRWATSVAGSIAREIPMFEATRPGLENAVNALKGKITIKDILEEQQTINP